jgi:uncharacterized protein involved in exopolysaccharide biosynthesis
MTQQAGDTYSRHLTDVVRRLWFVVLACTLIVLGISLALSLSQHKEYSAKAEILFREIPYDQILFGSSALPVPNPNRQAATNLKLVGLEAVSQRTGKVLGLSGGAVRKDISVSPQGEANIVSVTGTADSAAFAAKLANTYVRQYVGLRREVEQAQLRGAQRVLERQIAGVPQAARNGPFEQTLEKRAQQLHVLAALQNGGAEMASSAVPPGGPSAPTPKRDAILGLLLGLVLGVGLALTIDGIRSRERVLAPSLDAS